jgi:queuine tRNA-ribosyltransferase
MTCRSHHKAYIHHLFRQKEMSGGTLLSIHNVNHLVRQAQECRAAILEGAFQSYFQRQQQLHEADCLARAEARMIT